MWKAILRKKQVGQLGNIADYIGIMEKNMETTRVIWGLYSGYIGMMEKNMETIIIGYILGF